MLNDLRVQGESQWCGLIVRSHSYGQAACEGIVDYAVDSQINSDISEVEAVKVKTPEAKMIKDGLTMAEFLKIQK
jgi:hypothetical protein